MSRFVLFLFVISSLNSAYASITCGSLLKSLQSTENLITRDQLGVDFSNIVDSPQTFTLQGYENSIVRFSRPNTWGVPKEFHNKGVEVTISVANREEGLRLIEDLFAEHFNAQEFESSDQMGFIFGDGVYASFQSHKEKAGGIETSMSLFLSSEDRSSLGPDQSIVEALLKRGLIRVDASQLQFDMFNNTGRHEWAVNNFDGNRALTDDEMRALENLSGSGYSQVNTALRSGTGNADPRVALIDSALNKSVVNTEVSLYRSVSRDDLDLVWNQLLENPGSPLDLASDPAYLYTSLDPEVAKWWQGYDKRDSGIILKIRTPVGANAVYIDSGIIERRGYLEMVLPRDSRFTATRAYTDEDGYKILEVDLETGVQ